MSASLSHENGLGLELDTEALADVATDGFAEVQNVGGEGYFVAPSADIASAAITAHPDDVVGFGLEASERIGVLRDGFDDGGVGVAVCLVEDVPRGLVVAARGPLQLCRAYAGVAHESMPPLMVTLPE